jgi:hypothetical protein
MAEALITPKKQSLYPTMASLDNCMAYLQGQLPLTTPNQLKAALMTYHNTLLAQMKTENGFTKSGETVSERAKRLYPGQTFDIALPLTWVKNMKERGFNPVGHFVALYPEKNNGMSYYMAPVTEEGIRMAAIVTTMEA